MRIGSVCPAACGEKVDDLFRVEVVDVYDLVGGRFVRGRALDGEAPLHELVAADPRLGAAGAALLEPGVSVTRRTTPGGAGPAAVDAQLARFRELLAANADRLA